MANKHILIIGTGSAGKRHAQNLQGLGCRVSCMDSRQDRLDEARTEGIDMAAGYTSLEDALKAGGFDGAVVASPTAFHVEQCLACLERDLPILLEKPVAPTLAEARRLGEALERGTAPLLLGYTWRWWPALKRVREHLRKGTVGTLRHVSFVMSAHLADWHPWERYQDFFMASREQGGGALLDESHWIDQMIWLAGMPRRLSGQVGKISGPGDRLRRQRGHPGPLPRRIADIPAPGPLWPSAREEHQVRGRRGHPALGSRRTGRGQDHGPGVGAGDVRQRPE